LSSLIASLAAHPDPAGGIVTTVTREHPGLDVGRTPESFHLQILGPLRVWRDGIEVETGSPLQRCLLALLLARGGNPVSMSEIVDLLWGEDAPLSAVNTVHKYVGALRRILEPDLALRASGRWLVRHGPGYRFNANPEVLDLTAFRRSADAARHSLAQGDDARALKSRVKALRLWHGPAGGGLAETPDAQTIFDTLNREYLDLAVSSAQLARRRKRPRLVLDLLWQAAAVGPLHEPLHAELIANLTLAGHNAEALAAYRAIRDRLASELGIDPSPGLQLAYHEIGTAPIPPLREDTPEIAHDGSGLLSCPPTYHPSSAEPRSCPRCETCSPSGGQPDERQRSSPSTACPASARPSWRCD
jgi:DNA-binding SARP family transcriptional activator